MDLPELGPEQLKALTHPLRVAILRALRTDGPATATALASRLDESSGATSYHLRQLARHGFVEEVPDSGNGRDRWWRPAFPGHSVDTARWIEDPADRAVISMYEAVVIRNAAERAMDFVAEQGAGEWSREWVDASALNDLRLTLTPARLKRLVAKVEAVLRSFEKYEEGEHVIVQFQAFPRRAQPFVDGGEQ